MVLDPVAAQVELLISELEKMDASERVFFWTGWDKEPFSDEQFRQYLVPCKTLLALLTNRPLPDPTTIRVRTTAALNVRRAPVDGAIVTVLAVGTVLTVYEVQERAGWWKISEGTYAEMFVSAQYVVKV